MSAARHRQIGRGDDKRRKAANMRQAAYYAFRIIVIACGFIAGVLIMKAILEA